MKFNPWFWLVDRFASSSLFKWISKHIIAHLHFRVMGYPKLPASLYHEDSRRQDNKGLLDLIKENDKSLLFWCSSDSKSLASILIRWITKSKYSHSGIVFMHRGYPMIFHMKGKGLILEDLLDLISEVDTFTLKKVETEYSEVKQKYFEFLISNVLKIKYDYAQMLGGKDMYCSELVWDFLNQFPDAPEIVTQRYLGRDAFSPEDVSKVGETLFEKHP